MIPVSDAVKEAFLTGNPDTEISLVIDGVTYSSENILAGSVSIEESLCSADNFDLSRVEKNQLKFTLFNITENLPRLIGKTVIAKQTIHMPDSTDVDIPLGTYTIVDAVNSGNYLIRFTCYDSTTMLLDTIIDDWWNTEVTFPITIKNLIISLFTYLNVPYQPLPKEFTNSTYTIAERAAYIEDTTGAEFLGYIQEVIGSYIKADRAGNMRIVGEMYVGGLRPHIGLRPHTGLYPSAHTVMWSGSGDEKTEYRYPQIVRDLTIADYTIDQITKVQIRGTEDDIGIIAGEGDNAYVITGNPLLFNLTDEIGRPIAENILALLSLVSYVPFTGKFMAQPYLEVGDLVHIETIAGLEAISPLFSRTLSGSKLCFDKLTCNGEKEAEKVTSKNRMIQTLKQKTHRLDVTVDGLASEVTAIDETVGQHTTLIEQNAEAITTKVSQTDYNGNTIASLINQTATTIQIQADKINLTGYVTFNNLSTSGQTAINADNLTTGSINAINIYGSYIEGARIRFGDTNTVLASSSTTGVKFEGEGTVGFKTVGAFTVFNYTDTNYTTQRNHIHMSGSDTLRSAEIFNYDSNGVAANAVDLTSDSVHNMFEMLNKREGITANRIYADSNSGNDTNQVGILNFRNNVARNALRMSINSSNQNVGMYNYDASGNIIGNCNVTNGEFQAGYGDTAYLHINADGYWYVKVGGRGAYKMDWKSVKDINGNTITVLATNGAV